MRHLLLLFIGALAGYITWQFLDRQERNKARTLLTRHGLRIAAIAAVLALAIYVAALLPSTPLI